MRIIGGEFRSRRLKSLPGSAMRPTPDMLRETLFNVLAPRIPGCTFVDAYAGSGAVGIEALSRGAARVYFLESHPRAAAIIKANLESLDVIDRAVVLRARATEQLGRIAADIVFLDPPYDQPREYSAALRILGRKPPALVVAQHSVRQTLEEAYGELRRVRFLRQGSNALSFFEPASTVRRQQQGPN
ncbi:MAG: 16S rRNA (guanine(966)-N(2))-methyltransferase RsmD [Bryobacteraceae bacterium]